MHTSPSPAGGGLSAGTRAGWARSPGPAVLAMGCFAALLAPWARTGTATRSGYVFVRAVQGAGMVHGPFAHVLGWAVLAVPALAALSGATALVRSARASVVFCGLAGLVTLVFSAWLFVKFQSDVSPGTWAGLVLGTAAVATAARYVRQGSVLHAR